MDTKFEKNIRMSKNQNLTRDEMKILADDRNYFVRLSLRINHPEIDWDMVGIVQNIEM